MPKVSTEFMGFQLEASPAELKHSGRLAQAYSRCKQPQECQVEVWFVIPITQTKGLARVRAGACPATEPGDSLGSALRPVGAVAQEVVGRGIVVSGAIAVGAK